MPRRALLAIVAATAAVGAARAQTPMDFRALRQRTVPEYRNVPPKVLAFYYPWYGTAAGPGGAGRNIHWGRIDAAGKDIEASTHYPRLGAYDSHDPNVIDQHCRWAARAGLDGLVVSWWGHGDYTDRALPKILAACRRHQLAACVYYENVPGPATPKAAADDIAKLVRRYGKHPAYLTAAGRPVVFIYGRALEKLGLGGWLAAATQIGRRCDPAPALIGDRLSYGAACVFDGTHTYNTAGALRGKDPAEARNWAAATYAHWLQAPRRMRRIATLTVIPGYDDTKIRKPGLAVERYDGRLYQAQWEEALKAVPDWVLITSFNEWHEGSEIEPSAEDGEAYLRRTAEWARRFKAAPRPPAAAPAGIGADDRARLRAKLAGIRIGVLPDAQSIVPWWLAAEVRADLAGLSWRDLAEGRLSPKAYPVLLYAGGESYRRTVRQPGDVDAALERYVHNGGWLVAAPSMPWPFFYDEDGKVVNRSARFGLTLRMGWRQPPDGVKLRFVQGDEPLAHLPKDLPFPPFGDVRWRPFAAAEGRQHTSLLALRDEAGRDLGDAAALADLPGGGGVGYVWFALLRTPYAEALTYDVLDRLASRLRRP